MYNVTKSRSFKWSVITVGIVIIAWIMTWRFYAMWWFFIAFIDLAVFVYYVVVFLGSVIFWIRKRKIFNYPFVPLFINATAILIIVCTPSINRNKSYPKGTIDLYNFQKNCACRLHIETYCIYGGGALGSDMNSLYLTDSLNFRKYIGTYDEEEGMITTKCKGDSIFVEKTEKTTQSFKIDTSTIKGKINSVPNLNYKLKTINKEVFSLKELKSNHVFE
jgi:amino acid transporter